MTSADGAAASTRSAAPGLPPEIADEELPTHVLLSKVSQDRGVLGHVRHPHPWRPMAYFLVTLPVMLTTEIAGPMVTTRITARQVYASSGEVFIQIGGRVRTARTAAPPIAGAWCGRGWRRHGRPCDDGRGRARPAGCAPAYTRRVRAPGLPRRRKRSPCRRRTAFTTFTSFEQERICQFWMCQASIDEVVSPGVIGGVGTSTAAFVGRRWPA